MKCTRLGTPFEMAFETAEIKLIYTEIKHCFDSLNIIAEADRDVILQGIQNILGILEELESDFEQRKSNWWLDYEANTSSSLEALNNKLKVELGKLKSDLMAVHRNEDFNTW